jgi:outer membrane protein assembly factor BamB/HEAT repeat protein/predicted transcriptional regulator
MLTAIADYIKSRRNELGRHVLFTGHAVRTSPDERIVESLLHEMATTWAEEHDIDLPEDDPGPAALEQMAQGVPSHLERCRRLRAMVEDRRPSEAHTRLARMISDGYFPAIFTTDPTDLLQRALRNQHMEPETDYHLLVAGQDSPEEIELAISGSTRVVVVKCAGSMTQEFMPLSQDEVDSAIGQLGDVIETAFKTLSLFVGYTERDREFLEHIPDEGDRAFWINRIIPMDDEELFQELKMESPESVDYHRLQPYVTEMLASRASARHLICRDQGEPNAFFSGLEDRVARHRRSTSRQKKSGPTLSVLSGGPFRFLDHYRVEDAELFYGREQETDEVIEMIRDHRLSVLFGAMGRGKTSLLSAGVMARMLAEAEESDEHHGTPWLPIYVRCGDDPIEGARDAVSEALVEHDIARIDADRPLPELLAEAVELADRPVVLLVDQFEEYFVKTGDRLQQEFAAQLAEALEEVGDDLRVLFSIREDYLGRLYDLQEHFPEIFHNLYRLSKMSERQAKVAAIKPGSNFRLTIEEEVVDRVLEDLCHDGGCEPTELQIVMDRLYQTLSPRQHVIAPSAYEQLEGADRILRDYLEHALQQLPPWERRLVRNILKQMVQSSELKAVRSVERIASEVGQSEENVERILARLEDLRLVRRVGRQEKRQYEVVHEYMARKIEEWMTERQIEVKDVQDLLTRELGNYQKFGLLMQEGALRVLSTHRNELTISPEEMALIIRSSVHRQVDVGYWLGRVDELEELLEPTIKEMLHDKEDHVRRSALRALGPHVSRAYLKELVDLLDDEEEDIRELAEEYLRGLDRDLVHLLGRGTDEQRHLAAYALGRIESRRALRPLAQALKDGDEEMRDEVAEALMEMDPESTTRILLRRLRESPDAPWAVAYALGRVAQEPRAIREIEQARKNQPRSAQIAFALAMATAQRREFDAALGLLDESERLATTDVGHQNVREMRQEVLEQQERASQFEEWTTFHGNLHRVGRAVEQVSPPLKVRWRFQTRGPVVGGPAVGNGMVCVGSRDNYVYALDSASGQLRWETQTGDRVESTPAMVGDAIYVSSRDGLVYCIGAEEGDVRWDQDTGGPSRSSPAVVGDTLFVGNQRGRLLALETRSGRIRWEARAGDEISAAPTLAGDSIVVGSWDGVLRAFDRESGEPAWTHEAEEPIAAGASTDDGALYFGSDAEAVTALHAADGTQLWRTEVDGRVRCCPALSEQLAVVGCMDGKVYGIDREDGSLVWAFETEDEILASPAIAGNVVYAGSKDGALYALALDSGDELWRYSTSYAVYSSPATAEQMIVLGMQYYDVVAFVGEEFKPGALT